MRFSRTCRIKDKEREDMHEQYFNYHVYAYKFPFKMHYINKVYGCKYIEKSIEFIGYFYLILLITITKQFIM